MASKGAAGISYIEVMVSLAVFAVLVLTVLPILAQAGRNLRFAEDVYVAQLAAQSIMLAVRDGGAAAEEAARLGVADFEVWENPGFVAPQGMTFGGDIIAVAVWQGEGAERRIIGRAIGVR